MSYPKVDWKSIHEQTFFTADKCWETCGGGFCCSLNKLQELSDLRFIPVDGTTIIYMEEEYNYFSKLGDLPDVNFRTITLDFGAERPLKLIYLPCKLYGQCRGVTERPLFCKIYPFIPVLSIDGNIEDFYPGSIFDITSDALGVESPCSIRHEKERFLKHWNSKPALLEGIRHPYIILYSQVAKEFADIYTDMLVNNNKLMSLRGREFWNTWETLYLTGQLVDSALLKQKVFDFYTLIMKRYPGFSL